MLTLSLAVALAGGLPGAAAAEPHDVRLAQARLAILPGGRIVVSFDAGGDIRGLVTLTLTRDADGAVGGEWVLVSRYLQDLHPDGTPADHPPPEPEDGEPHREYIEIVERGSLSGAITGGSLSLDAAGKLARIEDLQLTVAHGSLSFDGATGIGWAQARRLDDQGASSGSLSLAF